MNPFQAELARRSSGNPFAAELARRSAPVSPDTIAQDQMALEGAAMDRASGLTMRDVFAPIGRAAQDVGGDVVNAVSTKSRLAYGAADDVLGGALPDVARPRPEDRSQYVGTLTDVGAAVAGGALTKAASSALQWAAKGAMRGGLPKSVVNLLPHKGSSSTFTGLPSIATGAATGTGIGALVAPGDELGIDSGPEAAAAGAGALAGAELAIVDTLIRNPVYRDIALSPAKGGMFSAMVGAVLGALGARAAGPGAVEQVIDYVAGLLADEEQSPAPGQADIARELLR